MLPGFALADHPDAISCHAEAAGQPSLGFRRGSNFTNKFVCQFGLGVLFTGDAWFGIVPGAPPLAVHVSDVVLLCPQPQVVRVDAGRVVATVQDLQAVGDGSEVNFVRKTVCEGGCFPVRQHAIAGGRFSPLPEPTPCCLGDIPPKANTNVYDLGFSVAVMATELAFGRRLRHERLATLLASFGRSDRLTRHAAPHLRCAGGRA
jgi:hypothetical protein